MLKALVIDPGKCTGCKQCEMACSYENENEFNVAKSRIRVFDFHEDARFVPYTCTQCAEAWCQQAAVHAMLGATAGSDAPAVGPADFAAAFEDRAQPGAEDAAPDERDLPPAPTGQYL